MTCSLLIASRFTQVAPLAILFTLLLVPSAGSLQGEDWPQFLGPQRNGVSTEKGLIEAWPENGLKVAWRANAGVGMSSVVVADKQAFTTAQSGGEQKLMAWNATDGKPLWETSIGADYENGQGNGPRATPTLDADSAYVFTGDGTLAAVDRKTGAIRWQHAVVKDHQGKVADYGMSASPLIVGKNVVVVAGAPGATLVAYNCESGELAWKSGNDPAGYASPTTIKINGEEQIVAFTGASCIGVRPQTGKQLWRYPFTTDYRCNTATPISVGGKVFISAGESHGSALLSITTKDGNSEVQEVWTSFGVRAIMKNEWQTSVLLGDNLFGLDNVGSAGPTTHLTCINATTGERVWQQPRFGKSNLIAADGKLFFTTMKGEVVIAKASAEGYHELGRAKLIGTTRQSPSLANGLLYVRDDREVVCIDLRQ